jgi:hypothetical protein
MQPSFTPGSRWWWRRRRRSRRRLLLLRRRRRRRRTTLATSSHSPTMTASRRPYEGGAVILDCHRAVIHGDPLY